MASKFRISSPWAYCYKIQEKEHWYSLWRTIEWHYTAPEATRAIQKYLLTSK